mgnify:CR=1 FL=1
MRRQLAEDWKWLSLYPLVRREWRRELGSWTGVSEATLDMLRHETRRGLWGVASGGEGGRGPSLERSAPRLPQEEGYGDGEEGGSTVQTGLSGSHGMVLT